MKIIKIKFLGREYEIQAENKKEEIGKIMNLQERLNNRVKNDLTKNNNYSDIHRLLIVALKLENRIDDLIADNKILSNKLHSINAKYENLQINEDKEINELKNHIKKIDKKIKLFIERISKTVD